MVVETIRIVFRLASNSLPSHMQEKIVPSILDKIIVLRTLTLHIQPAAYGQAVEQGFLVMIHY